MTELADRNEYPAARRSQTDWGAIWAGVFSFVAIWSVFGLLGIAVFASAGNSDAASPLTGMSLGMDVWAIALTIIAMYFGGLETGRLTGVGNRHDGLIHSLAAVWLKSRVPLNCGGEMCQSEVLRSFPVLARRKALRV